MAFRVNEMICACREELRVSSFYHTLILNGLFLSKTLLAIIMQMIDNLDNIVPESQNLKPPICGRIFTLKVISFQREHIQLRL